jgi:hypothetical protein
MTDIDKIEETIIECGHLFHYPCFMEYLKNTTEYNCLEKYQCPLCRHLCTKIPRPNSSLSMHLDKKTIQIILNKLYNLDKFFMLDNISYDIDRPVTSFETIHTKKKVMFRDIIDITSISREYRKMFNNFFYEYKKSYYGETEQYNPTIDYQHIVLHLFFSETKNDEHTKAIRYAQHADEFLELENALVFLAVLGVSIDQLRYISGYVSSIKYTFSTFPSRYEWLDPRTLVILTAVNIRNIPFIQNIVNAIENMQYKKHALRSDVIIKKMSLLRKIFTDVCISSRRDYSSIARLCESGGDIVINSCMEPDTSSYFLQYCNESRCVVDDRIELLGLVYNRRSISANIIKLALMHHLCMDDIRKFVNVSWPNMTNAIFEYINVYYGNNMAYVFRMMRKIYNHTHNQHSNVLDRILHAFVLTKLTYEETVYLLEHTPSYIIPTIERNVKRASLTDYEIVECVRVMQNIQQTTRLRIPYPKSYWGCVNIFGLTDIRDMRQLIDITKNFHHFIPAIERFLTNYYGCENTDKRIPMNEIERIFSRLRMISGPTISVMATMNIAYTKQDYESLIDILNVYRNIPTEIMSDVEFCKIVRQKNYDIEHVKRLHGAISKLPSQDDIPFFLSAVMMLYLGPEQVCEFIEALEKIDRDIWYIVFEFICQLNISYETILKVLDKCSSFDMCYHAGILHTLVYIDVDFIERIENMYMQIPFEIRGRLYAILSDKECSKFEFAKVYEIVSSLPTGEFLDFIEEHDIDIDLLYSYVENI